MINAKQKIGLALGFAGVFMFGGTLPATRLAVAFIDPLFLTAARWTIAGCAGLALLLVLRRRPPPRALWGELAITAFCTIVAFPLLMALAMVSVPAAHGGVPARGLPHPVELGHGGREGSAVERQAGHAVVRASSTIRAVSAESGSAKGASAVK